MEGGKDNGPPEVLSGDEVSYYIPPKFDLLGLTLLTEVSELNPTA